MPVSRSTLFRICNVSQLYGARHHFNKYVKLLTLNFWKHWWSLKDIWHIYGNFAIRGLGLCPLIMTRAHTLTVPPEQTVGKKITHIYIYQVKKKTNRTQCNLDNFRLRINQGNIQKCKLSKLWILFYNEQLTRSVCYSTKQ